MAPPAKYLDFSIRRGILGENSFPRVFHQTVIMNSPLQKLLANPRPIVACFPLYPPLELLDSLGFHPIIPWNLKPHIHNTDQSDRHVQNYVCSVARHLVEYLLTDGMEYIDGIVAYNACDTLRNIPEIIQSGLDERNTSIPIFTYHIPMTGAVGRSQPDYVREYIHNEINRLTRKLEAAFSVSFSAPRFLESVETYNAVRGLYRTLSGLLSEGQIDFPRFVTLLSDVLFMPISEQFSTLSAAVDGLKDAPRKEDGASRIIVSGILPPPPAVIEAMERSGLRVVGEDLAIFRRSFSYLPTPVKEPGDYYAGFYKNHYPCTTLHYLADQRIDAILTLCRDLQADGFVFLGEKFCEYEYFEFPHLEKKLKELGIKPLALEFSIDDSEHIGAVSTRIEAYSELLDG